MNGSLKLSLAVALALGSANALALGLGSIQVKSGLNEPLNAEIPVTGGPDETAGVSVALAAAADFERVGLSRSRILVPLDFQVAIGAKGNAVIKVTSKEPVRDPFLDFLIEVNWAKGKLLREYTVLLDPPTMAPAVKGSRASTAPLRDSSGVASAQQLPAKPTKPGKKPVGATTEPATPTAATEPKPAKPSAAPRAGDYGPVAAGETLWEVASATKPDDSVSLNQMMISLLRSNPSAFYKDNINSLKRGAILRVPSVEEIKAAGNAAAAAADVRSQNEIWRGGATSSPTLITDTGAAARATSIATSKPKPTDRLELVPPKAPKDKALAGAERAGSGSSGAGDVTTRAELARTKEALASREQESNELKSRVKELEDLKSKNDKLISLKDSELAELQKKLRELQDKASKTPVTTVVATPPASTSTPATTTVTSRPPPPGVTKEDVWGSASGEPLKPATSTTTPATTTPSTATTTPASTTPPSTSTLPTPTTTTPASTTSTTPATTTGSVPPASTTTTVTPPASTSTLTVTPPATTASTPPAVTSDGSATPATVTPPPVTPPPKPPVSTTTPVKTTTPAKVQPLPVAEPWYRKTWVLGLGGLALLSVVVLALVTLLRRPKAAAAPVGGASFGSAMADDAHAEEQGLLERLAQYPDDTSAHLELASLYYAQQDVDKFEAAAQAMYAHISDTASPEWEQVRGMGAELAPHNPLFVDADSSHHHYAQAPAPMRFDDFEDAQSLASSAPAPIHEEESGFDFDLNDRSAAKTVPPPSAAPARDDFSMDLPPASTFDTRISMPELQRPELQMPRLDDELATIDDAIGTKLDLAKAYLDMGDPDGARSMLEEVMGEGSDAQRNEARRLLAEIR